MESIGRLMTQLGNNCQPTEMLLHVILYNNSNINSSIMMQPNQNLMYQNTLKQKQQVYSQGLLEIGSVKMKQEIVLLMIRTMLVVPIVATVNTINYKVLLKPIACFMY